MSKKRHSSEEIIEHLRTIGNRIRVSEIQLRVILLDSTFLGFAICEKSTEPVCSMASSFGPAPLPPGTSGQEKIARLAPRLRRLNREDLAQMFYPTHFSQR